MLSIKNATAKDISLIQDIVKQVWPQTYTPIVGKEQVTYMLNLFYTPEALKKQMKLLGHRFIICYDDDEPVAFASWNEAEGNIYKLHKLYIITGRQGRGVGQTMLKHIVHEITAKGAVALLVNVNRFNFKAKMFYEKAGFTHVIDEDIDIGKGYFMNDHVLTMKISNP